MEVSFPLFFLKQPLSGLDETQIKQKYQNRNWHFEIRNAKHRKESDM